MKYLQTYESLRDQMTPKMTEEEMNDLIIPLKSVGHSIDKKGMTYIMLANGGYEFDGMHLDDIENDEWWKSLSDEDRKTVEEIKKNLKQYND